MIEGKVIADTAWHAIKRTVSICVVLAIVIGVPYFCYERGKIKGYSMCAKDRPTYGTVGTVVNNAEKEYKLLGIRFNIWKLRFGAGI